MECERRPVPASPRYHFPEGATHLKAAPVFRRGRTLVWAGFPSGTG